TPGSIIRATVRGVGEACITLGLILLLFAAYEVWGKTATVNAHQNDLEKQLAQNWDGPAPPTPTPNATKSSAPALPPPPGNATEQAGKARRPRGGHADGLHPQVQPLPAPGRPRAARPDPDHSPRGGPARGVGGLSIRCTHGSGATSRSASAAASPVRSCSSRA